MSKRTQKFSRRTKPLTEKQRRFVEAFCATGNATESARLAGYSEHQTTGYNLTKAVQYRHVQDAIAKRAKRQTAKMVINREERQEILTDIAKAKKSSPKEKCRSIDILNKMDGIYISKLEISVKSTPEELEEGVIALYRSKPELWERIKAGVEA